MKVLIYLFCTLLVFLSLLIIQVAYVSNAESHKRAGGIVLGVFALIAAVGILLFCLTSMPAV